MHRTFAIGLSVTGIQKEKTAADDHFPIVEVLRLHVTLMGLDDGAAQRQADAHAVGLVE
jgi:hypothetical protein